MGKKNDMIAVKYPIIEKSYADKFFANNGEVKIEIGKAIIAAPKYKADSFNLLNKWLKSNSFIMLNVNELYILIK